MEKNARNSSSFRHSNRCKFMPKMHRNTFGGCPDPLGSLSALPYPQRQSRGSYFQEEGRKGKEGEGREGRERDDRRERVGSERKGCVP